VNTADLPAAWLATCRALGARDDVAGAGATLVGAYAEPTRRYHTLAHLADVLTRVDTLADVAVDLDVVRLAAWFHDAVYDPAAADNEERSAALAGRALARLRLGRPVVAEVARLVRLTATHDPGPDDRDGAVLCDADLGVLALDPVGYAAYVAAVRAEYGQLSDGAWRSGRSAVLRGLLDRPHLFATSLGRDRWEAAARANVSAELAALGG
jgi:predicted metal-dependent HD superfamily phosphohydrolase